MLAFMMFMASIASQCSTKPEGQFSDITVRIERDYKSGEAFLVATGSAFECSQITLFAPDGQSYLLNLEEENALKNGDFYKVKIEASLSTDLQNWSKLSQFFDTAGLYKVRIESHKGQLAQSQLEWQFPECSFLTNQFEEWVEALKKYGGDLVKTKLGYQKSLEGKNFAKFTVSMSACSSLGMSIEIEGLSQEYNEQALETAIDILSLYNKEFIKTNTDQIRLLGTEPTEIYLKSTSYEVLEASSQIEDDLSYIFIGISFN